MVRKCCTYCVTRGRVLLIALAVSTVTFPFEHVLWERAPGFKEVMAFIIGHDE